MPIGYGYNFGGMLGSGGVSRPMGGVAPGGGGSPGAGGAGYAPGPRFGVGLPPPGGGYAAPPQLPPAPPWGGQPPQGGTAIGGPYGPGDPIYEGYMGRRRMDSVNAARPPMQGGGPAPWQPFPPPSGDVNTGRGFQGVVPNPQGSGMFSKPRGIKPPGGTTMGFDPYKPGGY